jgi:prepilin-type processing-associated H-X9-DG protein
MEKIIDGTSNTMMFGESLVAPPGGSLLAKITISYPGLHPRDMMLNLDPSNRKNILASRQSVLDVWKGTNWVEGAMYSAGFTGVMPPNSVSAILSNDQGHTSSGAWVTICLSSNHSGGANSCFADGSVHFITDTISNSSFSGSEVIYPCINGKYEVTEFSGESPYGIIGALSTINGGEAKSLQ